MVGRNAHWIAFVGQLRVGEVGNLIATETTYFPTLCAVGHDRNPTGGLGSVRLKHSLVHIAIVCPSCWNSKFIPIVIQAHVVAKLMSKGQASGAVSEGKTERLVPANSRR